ncbi:hypothetical protein TorRG33x02_013990 [Trema orientale]|uniref:Uncharacterized protein n=1 Tax=Trema orientale TaxID=63057 RepID=A0A2P5FXC0_TREOI|nr:hypothetical protein TorRG33x02_013990 [Trema orientale]
MKQMMKQRTNYIWIITNKELQWSLNSQCMESSGVVAFITKETLKASLGFHSGREERPKLLISLSNQSQNYNPNAKRGRWMENLDGCDEASNTAINGWAITGPLAQIYTYWQN